MFTVYLGWLLILASLTLGIIAIYITATRLGWAHYTWILLSAATPVPLLGPAIYLFILVKSARYRPLLQRSS